MSQYLCIADSQQGGGDVCMAVPSVAVRMYVFFDFWKKKCCIFCPPHVVDRLFVGIFIHTHINSLIEAYYLKQPKMTVYFTLNNIPLWKCHCSLYRNVSCSIRYVFLLYCPHLDVNYIDCVLFCFHFRLFVAV